jgi:succinate-semialdehyde dehydrogenase/glutarate-semialdehyde dehydrogenase
MSLAQHPELGTADEVAVVSDLPRGLYIGGEWRDAQEGRTFGVEDPATGRILAGVADAGVEDASDALSAAAEAFDRWRTTAPRERSDMLLAAFAMLTERQDDLALLLTLEMGKPLAESRGEVTYAASFLRWYAEEAVRIEGRFAANEAGSGRILTLRQPVGPCVFVTPWNFPLAMGTRKIAPALAAGCTCVVKPASQTPLSMLALAAILDEVGVPPGVVNVVPTSTSRPIVRALVTDPRVRKLSFTGSTEVGAALVEQSAEQMLRTSMELGGNAPFIVFEDADVDAAVEGAVIAKMRNGGQACTSANRFLVHERLAVAFSDRLTRRMAYMVVGRGTDPRSEVGPLIDESQRRSVERLVADAVSRGAQLRTGGSRIEGPGYFLAPTVLTSVPWDAAMMAEEIFGPVAGIATFRDEEEAVARANDTKYGLASYVYTRDLDRAIRVLERLDAGMVGLNQGLVSNAAAPFGGIKHSGFGREGGPEGLAEYLETKYVALAAGE